MTHLQCERKQRGFTLLELMISVAIIGILAAIAMPAYDSYITKSKIKAAQADLVGLSLAVENIFQKQLNYPKADSTEIKCLLDNACTTSSWKPSQSSDFTYSYSLKDTVYTIEAKGSTTKVSGCTITLDSLGVRKLDECIGGGKTWL